MSQITVITGMAIGQEQLLAASELAHACGADLDWVVQLVEIGVVHLEFETSSPQEWRFGSTALGSALAMRRLERDFGVGLEAAALILDLQHEVRRLRVALQAHSL